MVIKIEELHINEIEATKLDPNSSYIFKVNFDSSHSREKVTHYCNQIKKLLENIGISNYIIIPMNDSVNIEIIVQKN